VLVPFLLFFLFEHCFMQIASDRFGDGFVGDCGCARVFVTWIDSLPGLKQNLAARNPKCWSYTDALEVIWGSLTHNLAVSLNRKDKVAATSLRWIVQVQFVLPMFFLFSPLLVNSMCYAICESKIAAPHHANCERRNRASFQVLRNDKDPKEVLRKVPSRNPTNEKLDQDLAANSPRSFSFVTDSLGDLTPRPIHWWTFSPQLGCESPKRALLYPVKQDSRALSRVSEEPPIPTRPPRITPLPAPQRRQALRPTNEVGG
jgi:hypothetical protein